VDYILVERRPLSSSFVLLPVPGEQLSALALHLLVVRTDSCCIRVIKEKKRIGE
jgi:hypothetical protein